MNKENKRGVELSKIFKNVAGDKLKSVETLNRIGNILIDFSRGYPIWRYYGIFEYFFEKPLAERIIKELERHNLIEVLYPKKGGELTYYWLTPKGLEIALSFSNRRDSKRTLTFAEETRKFNIRIIWLTAGLIIIGIAQLVVSILQLSKMG